MKIQLLSDLHNEFFHSTEVPEIVDTDADVVVLAGDIDLGTRGLVWAASEAERMGKEIVYVAGNHEFYHHDMALVEKLRRIAADCERLHFLEDDEVVIGKLRFLGCTLWTDYFAAGDQALAMREARLTLNDHRLIRKGDRTFLPTDALDIHQGSRKWLKQQLDSCFEGTTVVISHHGPHRLCQHPWYPLSSLAAAFWSDLEALVAQADLWCFGHTHANLDTRFENCRVVANQRGYPGENVQQYRADFVVQV